MKWHEYLVIIEVLDNSKPLSWSHIEYPIAVAEERDDQKFVSQETMACNGILAEAPLQIVQIFLL